MPPPWSAGAQARIIGEIHGQQTVNVMHFATNDVINDQGQLDTLLLALADAMLQCAIDTLLPAVTQDWRLVQCDARRIAPSPSDPIIATAPGGSVGELGETSVSFAASLINIRSGSGGRNGRGRIFLPPPGEAQVQQSAIDGPTLVLLADFLTCVGTQFLGAAPVSNWHLGILSRTELGGVIGNFDNAFHPAVSLNPVANLAVMRSRRKGHGS